MKNRARRRVATALFPIVWIVGTLSLWPTVGRAQEAEVAPEARVAASGILVEIPLPLTARTVERTLATLAPVAASAGRVEGDPSQRSTVVLRFAQGEESTLATSFEDSLRFARAVSSRDWKRLRFVAWIDGEVTGHNVLPVLAAESIYVSPNGSIGDASLGQSLDDETIGLNYWAIAKRRSLFPEAIVGGLTAPELEVARISTADGQSAYASGAELTQLRRGGNVVSESVWSQPGQPLRLDADRLRELRAAVAIVESQAELLDRLGLTRLDSPSVGDAGEAVATLLRIAGPIGPQRVRRWQSNLAATTEASETNTWLVSIDSPGGNLSQSVALAAVLSDPGPTIRNVGGFVGGQARGDAAIVALACRPLWMAPDATIGGSGGDAIESSDVDRERELLTMIAAATGRSETLLRGLLDPSLEVHRYTNLRTGRIRYATPDELAEADADETWKREERIDFTEPLSAKRAVELGLAEGEVADLTAAAVALGLPVVPVELADRGLVRWVERLGRSDGLALGMLFVGFLMLSTEASAPGLGIPGFIAMLCFAFFFWTKFLAGTAEWLELLAFGLGIACLAIEVFVLPGFGVFGIGGMALTILGVVLMSQTFVIPRNAYQLAEATRGIYIAIGGLAGIVMGLFAVRMFLPRAALASGLSMGVPEPGIDESERVARFDHLFGAVGQTTTPLRPSGKARFGDALVSVVSDASAIESGQSVRVVQVLGNRIVVEAVDG